MAPDCVVEARGGTASASSGSDMLDHEEPCVATATSETRGHRTKNSERATLTQIHAALQNKILELEEVEAGEREAAKSRKKVLRDVQKCLACKDKSIQDKLEFLHKKFVEQVTEQGVLEKDLLTLQKQSDRIAAERDTVQQNLKRANLMNDKLQELCRTLQKQSHEVLEESKQRAQHEADQRKTLSDKMEATVKDVTARLGHQTTKHIEENGALRERLEKLLKFCEELDKGYKTQISKKDEEIEVLSKQLQEQEFISKQEAERANILQEQCKKLEDARNELQQELDVFRNKFKEFQGTIKASNKMFSQLKSEIKGSKKNHEVLRKENELLKEKCTKKDETVRVLLNQVEVATSQSESMRSTLNGMGAQHSKLKAQKDSLEGLCRALQKEVQNLRSSAGDSGGDNQPKSNPSSPADERARQEAEKPVETDLQAQDEAQA